MNHAVQTDSFPISHWFRGIGRASAIVLFVSWLTFVVAESFSEVTKTPSWDIYLQAAVLSVIFAGYAVGWRHEAVGGLIAILGTVAFFIVDAFTTKAGAAIDAVALFAVPGVFYVLAWMLDRGPSRHIGRLI